MTKQKPQAEDWNLIWGYIHTTKAFDLLQKRLTESAVEARRDDGIVIPGINWFPVDDVSIAGIK